MLIDKLASFADNLAFDGTPSELDTLNVRPGPGVPIIAYIVGHSLVGVTGVKIRDKALPGDSFADRMTLNFSASEVNEGAIQFELPSNLKRYVTLSLVGATAGNYTAAISLAGIQTSL